MKKRVLFLDSLPFDTEIQVGSHNYARLFRGAGYEVFSLASYLNLKRLLRRSPDDIELIRNWQAGVRRSQEGIYSYTPLCLFPYIRAPLLDNLPLARRCLKYCQPNLGTILRKCGFREVDVLFVNNVRLISVLKYVRAAKVAFRISDRIEGFQNVPKTIVALQNEVARSADMLFATSRGLYDEAKRLNERTVYLPNAVRESFIPEPDETFDCPPELCEIAGPVILYVGALSDWFDYDLYAFGLDRIRDASFVIIGPVTGNDRGRIQAILDGFGRDYPHFHYLGPKAHGILKNYLAHADVGIIPFQVNSFTDEINPVKLFEYASFGLPTVATDMAEVHGYPEMVRVAKTPEGYVKELRHALEKKKTEGPKYRFAARQHTWERRFSTILKNLESLRRDPLPVNV